MFNPQNEQYDSRLLTIPREMQICIYEAYFEIDTCCFLKAINAPTPIQLNTAMRWEVKNSGYPDSYRLLVLCKKVYNEAIAVLYGKKSFGFHVQDVNHLPNFNKYHAFPPTSTGMRFSGLRQITFSCDANSLAYNKTLMRAFLNHTNTHSNAIVGLRLTTGQREKDWIDVSIDLRKIHENIKTALAGIEDASGEELKGISRFHLRRVMKALVDIAEEDAQNDLKAMEKVRELRKCDQEEHAQGGTAWNAFGRTEGQQSDDVMDEILELGALVDKMSSSCDV